MAPITPIQKTSSIMTSTPGWVNTLAGGVPGAVAAYDFVNQLYWQQGDPTGGLVFVGTPEFSSNGLLNDGSYTAFAIVPGNLPAASILTTTYQCSSFGNPPYIQSKNSAIGFTDSSATVTQMSSGGPLVPIATVNLGSGNLITGLCSRALGFDPNGVSAVANAGTVVTHGNVNVAVLEIRFINTTAPIGGYIKNVVVWPSRLPDATLQGLT